MSARPLSAGQLASARQGAAPPVLFDIREPVEAERGHIDGATNLPRRRIEFRLADLVRDPATPIVVYDDADGRAELSAATLVALGRADVAWLDGGLPAWRAAGGSLATGNNVPSKKFGEQVQHERQVPAIDPGTLLRWQREGRRIAICDVRTPEEHRRGCIPGAMPTPSFDVALQAADLAASHDTVVLHCAGRTRSIISTRTLVEMGFDNVVALENGTMGWLLTGHALEQGSTRVGRAASPKSREHAETVARRLADAAGVRRIDPDGLCALLGEAERNRHVFDVRSLPEHVCGHIPGSVALPGGQAVQRADDFIAVRDAPIVLVDAEEARANLTAMWLRRMGLADVSVLAGGVRQWSREGRPLATGRARAAPLGMAAAQAGMTALEADACGRWLAAHRGAPVLDVDTSARFRRGHLPGAHWVPRGWLESRIGSVAPHRAQPLLVTCDNGTQSVYAAAALRTLGYIQVHVLAGGTRAWTAAGGELGTADLPPQDDELLAPYQRGEQAMRDYIDWEKLLVPDSPPPAVASAP